MNAPLPAASPFCPSTPPRNISPSLFAAFIFWEAEIGGPSGFLLQEPGIERETAEIVQEGNQARFSWAARRDFSR